VISAYGLTETASIVTSVPTEIDEKFAETKAASVGVPLYNTLIKVCTHLNIVRTRFGNNYEGLVAIALILQLSILKEFKLNVFL
jgi:acyl-CoA synthetase (AMP-forming)/AMP-acid ligase II